MKIEEFVKELNLKELNLYERFILKIHRKLFEKVYKLGITFGFNSK